MLYPTRDETVAAIARNRERLSEVFRVVTAPWDAVRWAWDKRNTASIAEQVGVPAPRSWQPADLAEVDQIDGDAPWAIKPAIKEHFFYATKAKAWRADSREELRTLLEKAWAIAGQGQMIVQELIPGDGRQQFAYCALYSKGEPVATMVCRRRRQHPPDFGRASTFVETIDEPEVEALSERILRTINYDGLGRARVQARPAHRRLQAARLQRAHLGLPHDRPRRRRRLPVPALPPGARGSGRAAARAGRRPLGPPAHRPADRLGADPGRRLHASRVPADAAQCARGETMRRWCCSGAWLVRIADAKTLVADRLVAGARAALAALAALAGVTAAGAPRS